MSASQESVHLHGKGHKGPDRFKLSARILSCILILHAVALCLRDKDLSFWTPMMAFWSMMCSVTTSGLYYTGIKKSVLHSCIAGISSSVVFYLTRRVGINDIFLASLILTSLLAAFNRTYSIMPAVVSLLVLEFLSEKLEKKSDDTSLVAQRVVAVVIGCSVALAVDSLMSTELFERMFEKLTKHSRS